MRVLASSGAATVTDVVMLLLLTGIRVPVMLATTLGCLAGGVVNFFVSRRYVFRPARAVEDRRQAAVVGRQLAFYAVVVVGAGAFFSGLLVDAIHSGTGAPLLGAKALAAVLMLLGWNYPVSKRLFRQGGTS
jgi:putative flippase GtrA